MPCYTKPETTCGELISEACVTIVDNTIFTTCPSWVDVPDTLECFRQSDWNALFGANICNLYTLIGELPTCAPSANPGSGILGRIGLECLEECDPDLGAPFKPISSGNPGATVGTELQNVYTALCSLKTTLNSWVDLPLPEDFDLGCIGDKCCTTPPATLGELLAAMVAKICCITGNAVDSSGIVLDTPTTGACPDC